METTSDNLVPPEEIKTMEPFKKPVLIGKIGKLPKKVTQTTTNKNVNKTTTPEEKNDFIQDQNVTQSSEINKEVNQSQQITLSYKEPPWSGMPDSVSKPYKFEVLKNGCIIETVDLMSRPFWTFGRLADCNICMQHPTVSRYHAVLQYRREPSETDSIGFYIYDLGGTHGTFLNKRRLKPNIYVRIQVGHMLKFGCSTRSYILTGPEDDAEAESELSITELKQKRADELRRLEEEALRAKQLEEERKRKEEEKGIDWGLGEDADEETDLTENPYAQSNNEQLYLDDPKKALRGFFEREGFNLDYDCTEQGIGQFLCKVELPIDDEVGRPIVAEVLHKGKKKEAVIQCALEACRILDRHGVLRQAVHESRKRKVKNWEENDFYDSDDDTFLDRTGTIEKKREMRMKSKQPQQPETYESLLEKEKSLREEISKIEQQLRETENLNKNKSANNEEDSLDSFMKELNQPKLDKQTLIKLKMEITRLKKEHANVVRLANIAKPANLPNLELPSSSSTNNSKSSKFPLYGKRLKVKVQLPNRPKEVNTSIESDEEEEMDSIPEKSNEIHAETKSNKSLIDEVKTIKMVDDVREDSTKIDSMHKKSDDDLKNVQKYVIQPSTSDDKLVEDEKTDELETDEKRKKRNQRRIQQRQEKAAVEKQRGYQEDAVKDNYSMWVPPTDQSGDGRTNLNEKYGY